MKLKMFLVLMLFCLGLHSADNLKPVFDSTSPTTVQTIRDFNTSIAMFQIDGYSIVDKFGFNQTIETTSDPEDVWEVGGLYPYDADGTAPILYLSSSDASDTEPISVQGLDINGDFVDQEITLTGQTNALLTTPLWRVFRLENNGTTDIQGTVYCHTDPVPSSGVPLTVNIRAVIQGNNNQTEMAVYTIPKGKIGFLYRGELGVQLSGGAGALAEFARIQYQSRRFGKVFKVKKSITCMVGGGSALYQDPRTFPDIIPALTDIKINVLEVSTTLGTWAAFDILLVDEDKFRKSFLKAIGQPGY